MTPAAFYWPETGRLECLGTFPSRPSLLDRGQNDGVSRRYVEMQDRGELSTLGDATVPVAAWLREVMAYVDGEPVAALTADRYKQAELGEALTEPGSVRRSSGAAKASKMAARIANGFGARLMTARSKPLPRCCCAPRSLMPSRCGIPQTT